MSQGLSSSSDLCWPTFEDEYKQVESSESNESSNEMNPDYRAQLNQVSFNLDELIDEAFDSKRSIEFIQPTCASLSGP